MTRETHRVELQPAYLLHTRSYRETSLLADWLTPDHGRVSGVVRGAGTGSSKLRGRLQPFSRLLLSWSGRGELKTVTTVEAEGVPARLIGRALFSGLYMNELLERLLRVQEPQQAIFYLYEQAVSALAVGQPIEPVLRRFERLLLEELGYGIPFDVLNSMPADQQQACYHYGLEGDMALMSADTDAPPVRCFYASELAAIADDNYAEPQTLKAAKRLMRLALQPLLGDRPLRSRALFAK